MGEHAGSAEDYMMDKKLKFIQYLEKNGCFASVVSISHLEELGAEIRGLHDRHLLSDGIFNYTGTKRPFHAPQLPRSMRGARSIIIVATPQPIIRTTFRWKGDAYKLLVPPTYFDAYKVIRETKALLADAFKPRKYRFVWARLPLKLLAVRSGLALYGRNNVTYVSKLGSFYRLTAFYSDFDSPTDYWQDEKAMSQCSKCKACMTACPTGVIQQDRFLVRAEKCLTFLNEKASKDRFPPSLDVREHNALIGCLRCQLACPQNRQVRDWFEDRGEFSEDETEYLLKGRFSGKKAERIERKLKKLGVDLTIFPRNLEVLLKHVS